MKALNFEHLDILNYFEMRMDKMLLIKSVQNPVTYHRDYLAAPQARNYEVGPVRFKPINRIMSNFFSSSI